MQLLKACVPAVRCWICYLKSLVHLFLTQLAIQFPAELQRAGSALICVIEFKKLIGARNLTTPKGSQIQFCICLNNGDIIVEGKNLYGEGVKLVARHEANSQLGAVFLSKAIHD